MADKTLLHFHAEEQQRKKKSAAENGVGEGAVFGMPPNCGSIGGQNTYPKEVGRDAGITFRSLPVRSATTCEQGYERGRAKQHDRRRLGHRAQEACGVSVAELREV